jgi:hypothetical protein
LDPCPDVRGSFMNLRRGSVGLGRECGRGQSSRRKQEAAITAKLAQLELAERIGVVNYGRT